MISKVKDKDHIDFDGLTINWINEKGKSCSYGIDDIKQIDIDWLRWWSKYEIYVKRNDDVQLRVLTGKTIPLSDDPVWNAVCWPAHYIDVEVHFRTAVISHAIIFYGKTLEGKVLY